MIETWCCNFTLIRTLSGRLLKEDWKSAWETGFCHRCHCFIDEPSTRNELFQNGKPQYLLGLESFHRHGSFVRLFKKTNAVTSVKIVQKTNAVTFVQTSPRMSQTTAGNLLPPQSSSNSGKGVNDDSENDFAVGTLDSEQVGRLSF